jgi:hypothetical protein
LVNLGGGSNLHPSLSVPLCAKQVGQHNTAMVDRLDMTTDRVVQPHEPLPAELELPPGVPRWRWLLVDGALAEALNLEESMPAMEEVWLEDIQTPLDHRIFFVAQVVYLSCLVEDIGERRLRIFLIFERSAFAPPSSTLSPQLDILVPMVPSERISKLARKEDCCRVTPYTSHGHLAFAAHVCRGSADCSWCATGGVP